MNEYESLQYRMAEYFEAADQLTRINPHIKAAAIRWLDATRCQNFWAAETWAKGIDSVEFHRVLKLMRYAKLAISVKHLPVDERVPALMAAGHFDGLHERDAIELGILARTVN